MTSKLIYEQALGLKNNFLLLFSPLLLRIMKIDNINGQSLQIVLI